MNKIEWYERTAEIIIEKLEEFYQKFYPKCQVEDIGNGYRLQPCPMCGHNDCCTVGEAVHCFSGSCGWRGTHINAWYDYATNKLGKSLGEAIKELDQFTGLFFPVAGEDFENYKKHQTQQQILAEAEKFYHEQFMTCKKDFKYIDKDTSQEKSMTPMEYMLSIRLRKPDTLKAYRVGFSLNYIDLHTRLLGLGFDKEEIKEAKIWVPEGLFIFFYRHPITKDIVRLNTKNPFDIRKKVRDENQAEKEEGVIKGFSTGNKMPLFSVGFSFKKPFGMFEGEHDFFSAIEHGCDNAVCIGGNPSEDELKILERAESIMYSATDNDAAGVKYFNMLNTMFPHKDFRRISWPEKFKDIDEYYVRGGYEAKDWKQLCDEAEIIEVTPEEHKFFHFGNKWTIVNRRFKLDFTISKKDTKGNLTGTVDFYEHGKIIDKSIDTALVKCKVKMKPFNFYLAEKIEDYFNNKLEEKTTEELIDIYWYSAYKASIIKLLAKKVYDSNNEDNLVNNLKVRLKTPEGSDDVFDAILKEVNDIQNQSMTVSFSDIPRIRVSQYFNVKNNDAYFYFINMKTDGDAKRKLPYLLRNDGQLIRLDLLKRKDEQCLLLIDNKYELPNEINRAILDLRECSLVQEWVEKFVNNEIPDEELEPSFLIREIERYIKKFYYTNDDDVYKVLALYIYATYYYELFAQMPYLYLNGEKGSGKTVLDSVIYMLAFNAKMAIDISDASLFRMVSIEGGTIIMDEMESLTSRSKTMDSTMASVLKGGYKRMGQIYRMNKDDGTVVDGFDSYGPKIISNIFGIGDDVISDRCIPISTYRLKLTADTRMEDPKDYISEKLPEIRAITSKCCLSALKNFQKLKAIFDNNLFVTGNARLSEILTPILATAKLVDIPEKEFLIQKYPDKSIDELAGQYETGLMSYYNKSIKSAKEDTEANTPEGIIKKVTAQVAKELWGIIPLKEREYTITEKHKYQEEIRVNKEEGWFEINVVHYKCFIEEHLPGETAYTRIIPRWIKTCYKLDEKEQIKRRTIRVENEDLIREFKGNSSPKINGYRFFFKDFIDSDFLTGEKRTAEEEDKQITKANMDSKLF